MAEMGKLKPHKEDELAARVLTTIDTEWNSAHRDIRIRAADSFHNDRIRKSGETTKRGISCDFYIALCRLGRYSSGQSLRLRVFFSQRPGGSAEGHPGQLRRPPISGEVGAVGREEMGELEERKEWKEW